MLLSSPRSFPDPNTCQCIATAHTPEGKDYPASAAAVPAPTWAAHFPSHIQRQWHPALPSGYGHGPRSFPPGIMKILVFSCLPVLPVSQQHKSSPPHHVYRITSNVCRTICLMPLEHLGMVKPWLGGQEVTQLWMCWDVGSCWAHQVLFDALYEE